ncbi:hypothetical protein GCM10011333_12210 [Sediminivirga luteola]|uniref:DUF4326 domain-containing protein n=1 Tax=Sediminivirga luteola TaxID=1774748 RepID=A0A8J2TX34_9MICO|nr:hypothetical protein GCM10011333_12210 [Sediminivirga luteola]
MKGWRMPADTIYVGRGTRWGNPWHGRGGTTYGPAWWEYRSRAMSEVTRGTSDNEKVHLYRTNSDPHASAAHAVELFRTYCDVMDRDHKHEFAAWVHPLRGRDLACWCRLDAPCHADVLLEIANQEVTT